MATTSRPQAGAVSAIQQLHEQPQAFSLFAMLRVLEALHPQAPRLGASRRPGEEAVRLSQAPTLAFAPTEVASAEERARWEIEQFVFGVFGPQGALPSHLTELAFERARHHDDPTLRDFVNTFQHRFIGLFYRAWAESEPAAQADRPETDGFRRVVGALIGLDTPAGWMRDSVLDDAKLARAGLIVPGARSADALEALLADYFGLAFEVKAYVPRWLDIPHDARLRLAGDREHATLGQGATLGASSWQANHAFEIAVGPLDLETLEHFLPGSPALGELRDLVRLFTNGEWDWQLRILVRAREAAPIVLGAAGRLGWTSWLTGRGTVADDVVIQGDDRHINA